MEKYQGNLTIDDVIVGEDTLNLKSGFRSIITDKTSNSVEVKNFRSSETGVDSTNWYALDWFNRFFRYYKDGEDKKNFVRKKKKTKSNEEIDKIVGERIQEIW